ncbi:MAG: hypothetical protein LC687_07400 [Actinobacteria bacterium]|nr:hypothetical protein [Actinomycetota bacterium]
MSKEHPVTRIKQYRLLTVAYGILVLLVIAGFVRSEAVSNELDLESQRRANLLCELSNDNQENLVTVLERIFEQPISSNVTDETYKARQEFLDEIHRTLGPITCPPSPDDISNTVSE